MKKLMVLSVIVLGYATNSAASPGLITSPKCDSLTCISTSQHKNLNHVRYVCNHGKHRSKRWSCKAAKWLSREFQETQKAMAPPPAPATSESTSGAGIPHYSEWLCIHSHEGSWTDPGAPYYGGLQMDWDFMSTYGGELLSSKGTADHWTPYEQMMVAERAWRDRGFAPWPTTAAMCGLL